MASHVVPRSTSSSRAMTNFLKGHSWHHENEDVWLEDTRHKFSHWLTNTKTMFVGVFFFKSYIRARKAHKQPQKNNRMKTWHWEQMCTVQQDDSVSKKTKKLSPFSPSNSHWHFQLIYRPAFLSVLACEGCLICSFPWEPSYQQQACSNKQAELTIRAREKYIKVQASLSKRDKAEVIFFVFKRTRYT